MYRLSPVIEESFSELNSENSSFIENDKNDKNNNFMKIINFIMLLPYNFFNFLSECIKQENNNFEYY
tara:strand:- start:1679 stop:1879 length:201 start_codon:yes stop_codon:yes gene_type:complete